jgi:class 3 adenylate cyclase
MSSMPGGTVTFLFSDIEGSTRLVRELGDTYGEVLSRQRRILRDTASAHDGTEIDTQGDAFFFSFGRARDAAAAAVAAQRALREERWPEGAGVRVRMGLHTGEPAVGEEGYVGLDVHRAARICSAAHGGQVLVSETTRALLGAAQRDTFSLRDLGEQHLKDLDEPEHLFQLVVAGADEEFPAPRSRQTSSADTLAAKIEAEVERMVLDSFRDGVDTTKRPTAIVGLAATGLAVLALVIVFFVGVGWALWAALT